SFSKGDAEGMIRCYHDRIEFCDPAFGSLQGEDARNMWRMLTTRSKGQLKISFSNIKSEATKASADWEAIYYFGKDKRKVINKISAEFEFRDGKIIRHTDRFDMWTWSRQALGWKGYLLGWSSFLKNKIKKQAKEQLKAYSKK
ncbi:MAG: nuclear transport factor 2 family protein, partial [Cytophagaceae bacterium]